MYRSGDVGRWLPNGNIEYIGRRDQQVKVRGYRIELGELENALLAQPHVRETAVCHYEDELFGDYLVAYVVADAEMRMESLRDALADTLPNYMVPSYFLQIPQMPLTPNGKIDRKRLPPPGSTDAGSQKEYIAPRNEVEQKLAAIWESVLVRERISVNDNFFHLGGHSLKAIQVLSRIHREFNVELDLGILFMVPVLENLADRINDDLWFRTASNGADAVFKEIRL